MLWRFPYLDLLFAPQSVLMGSVTCVPYILVDLELCCPNQKPLATYRLLPLK